MCRTFAEGRDSARNSIKRRFDHARVFEGENRFVAVAEVSERAILDMLENVLCLKVAPHAIRVVEGGEDMSVKLAIRPIIHRGPAMIASVHL